jgi:hypothetical protein
VRGEADDVVYKSFKVESEDEWVDEDEEVDYWIMSKAV